MKNFHKTYKLLEARFKDRTKPFVHIIDVPMFSIFVNRDFLSNPKNEMLWELTEDLVIDCFSEARKHIQKIGFRAMHANAVMSPLGNDNRWGEAYGNHEKKSAKFRHQTRHMRITTKYLNYLNKAPETGVPDLINTIVHEWAHLWMYNNGREFMRACKEYYDAIYHSQEDLIYKKYYRQDFKTSVSKFTDEVIALSQKVNTFPTFEQKYIKDLLVKLIKNLTTDLEVNSVAPYSRHIAFLLMGEIKQLWKNGADDSTIAQSIRNIIDNDLRVENTLREMKNTNIMAEIPQKTLNKQLAVFGNWVSAYGMTNSSEMWATAIEHFLDLDVYHQGKILELMGNY